MDEKVHSYTLWMLEQNSEHLTIQFLPRSASSQTNHFWNSTGITEYKR